MLHGFQLELLGRQVIADWIRGVEQDRLARTPRFVSKGLPLRDRMGRALMPLGCSPQSLPCRC